MDFVEDFVYFFTLRGEQSSPLVFSPNRAFECVPFPGQAPRWTYVSGLRRSELSAQNLYESALAAYLSQPPT